MKGKAEADYTFYAMVTELEGILNSETDHMELIRLIDQEEFIKLRERICSVFDIENRFIGKFGCEVEFGDVSDAVRGSTFALYPQGTNLNKYICPEERHKWCEDILTRMDYSAENN